VIVGPEARLCFQSWSVSWQAGDLGFSDSTLVGAGAMVPLGEDPQSGLGGRGGDEFRDDLIGGVRPSLPVPGDEPEHSVLDFVVPVRGAGRVAAGGDGQSGLGGQGSQLLLTQPVAAPIGAAAIRRWTSSSGVSVSAHGSQPQRLASDREGAGRRGLTESTKPAGRAATLDRCSEAAATSGRPVVAPVSGDAPRPRVRLPDPPVASRCPNGPGASTPGRSAVRHWACLLSRLVRMYRRARLFVGVTGTSFGLAAATVPQ